MLLHDAAQETARVLAPLVYGVTVNWNRADDTIECVRSLVAQRDANIRVLVVDNGSTDDSVATIRAAFPDLELLRLENNLGFAGGYNTGIRYALAHDADYVFIINNDACADACAVRELLHYTSDDAPIVAPAIFYADASECIWSVGGHVSPLLLEMTDDHGRNHLLPSAPVARDFVSGCALLIRRDVFERVGLFDEHFFFYYEDLDFCLRARRQGYQLLLVPQARVMHKVSQSTGGANAPMERYLMARGSARYFRKHMRLWQAPLIISFRLLSALRSTARLIFARQFASLCAYWRGLLCGWLER